MNFFTITVIAVSLAMDAFAVSVVSGSAYKQLKIKHAFRIAVFFGGFQAIMPLIGSSAGISVKEYVTGYDHWVAFALLSTIEAIGRLVLIGLGAKILFEHLVF